MSSVIFCKKFMSQATATFYFSAYKIVLLYNGFFSAITFAKPTSLFAVRCSFLYHGKPGKSFA